MSIKIATRLVDDLALAKDPDAEVPADKTVQFALAGSAWEIDLTAANEEKFRKKLEPYMRAGRRLRTSRARPATARPATARRRSMEIRQWARAKGIEISERGRIPAGVIEQYEMSAGLRA